MGDMFVSLRWRLLLLVVVASAPPAALTLYTASEGHRRQTAAWQQRARDLAQAVTRQEQEVVGGTRQLLLAVADSAAVRSRQRNACKKLLARLLTDYPRYANFGVADTNGLVLASAGPLAGPENLADRTFFRRVLQTGAFALGEYPV